MAMKACRRWEKSRRNNTQYTLKPARTLNLHCVQIVHILSLLTLWYYALLLLLLCNYYSFTLARKCVCVYGIYYCSPHVNNGCWFGCCFSNGSFVLSVSQMLFAYWIDFEYRFECLPARACAFKNCWSYTSNAATSSSCGNIWKLVLYCQMFVCRSNNARCNSGMGLHCGLNSDLIRTWSRYSRLESPKSILSQWSIPRGAPGRTAALFLSCTICFAAAAQPPFTFQTPRHYWHIHTVNVHNKLCCRNGHCPTDQRAAPPGDAPSPTANATSWSHQRGGCRPFGIVVVTDIVVVVAGEKWCQRHQHTIPNVVCCIWATIVFVIYTFTHTNHHYYSTH